MDFARRLLEKYGWADGKGLGKHEDGISKALKPKLKRSVTGIGHDAASEFNEHWWQKLYDKASSNIQVEDSKGKTKRIKTVEDSEFIITNSMWHLKKKKKEKSINENEYQDYFVKKAVLTGGGAKMEDVDSSDSDDEVGKDAVKMTDEELFAACGGRTAHKGARHGLKALGKLARIEQQEQMMLKLPKYEGYSHTKNGKIKIDQKVNIKDKNDIQSISTVENINKKIEEIKNGSSKNKQSVNNVENCISIKEKSTDNNCEESLRDEVVYMSKDIDNKKRKKHKSNKCKQPVNNEEIFNIELGLSDNVNDDKLNSSKIKVENNKKIITYNESTGESIDLVSEVNITLNNDTVSCGENKKKKKSKSNEIVKENTDNIVVNLEDSNEIDFNDILKVIKLSKKKKNKKSNNQNQKSVNIITQSSGDAETFDTAGKSPYCYEDKTDYSPKETITIYPDEVIRHSNPKKRKHESENNNAENNKKKKKRKHRDP